MNIQLCCVPYESGKRAARMGAGPLHLLEAGLVAHLERAGHEVELEIVEVPSIPLMPEPKVGLEFNHRLAGIVAAARGSGRLPVTLAGSCYSAIGTVSGLGPASSGVVWLDSHADFNTPDTTVTGFLDGMSLAMLTGRCWQQLARAVPGFEPVAERNVCLVGARDLDPLETELLARSDVLVVRVDEMSSRLRTSLEGLRDRVDQVYLHLDLDVLDPAEMRANELAAPRGPSLADTLAAVRVIGTTLPIGAIALTAYDPACDPEDRVCDAAFKLLDAVIETAA